MKIIMEIISSKITPLSYSLLLHFFSIAICFIKRLQGKKLYNKKLLLPTTF